VSLINKMLQELDKRHAAQGVVASAGGAARVAPVAHPVQRARVGSELFWWAMAVLMIAAIGWLGWVMWQLTPKTVVNEVALRSPPRSAARAEPAAQAPVADTASASGSGAPAAGMESIAATASNPSSAAASPDMLKLATEITTPISARRSTAPVRDARPAASKPEAAPAVSRAAPQPASALSDKPAPPQAARSEIPPPAPAKPTPPPASGARPIAPAADAGRIDRRITSTARERADAEYRRSAGLINQGRVAEGMDGLRNALAIDGNYEAPRQTLVALLVEQRRMDEAVSQLQQGLELNPSNSAFAMLLARILVDRQSLAAAVALLQKHAPSAGTNADYHAFLAALYQRLGRHDEAVQEYKVALQLSPGAGVWWVGMGISQEAAGHRKEALEAFRQARAAGNLAGDVLAYVDQRLKSLQ
jgi:MSHA biogenesis protein MshN